MHQTIRIIVYEYNEKGARQKAEQILNEYIIQGEYGVFDYGTFFDEDDSTVSGKARWGNISAVSLADSKDGKKLIDDGMKFTKDAFLKNMRNIRTAIDKYSDEELFEEKLLDTKKKILSELSDEKKNRSELGFFKYYCGSVSPYRNSNIYLYDNDGEGISSSSHLNNVLNKWNKKNRSQIYVVPVDVHY